MGKFDNAFEGAGVPTGETANTGGTGYTPEQYNEWHQRVVDTCGTQKKAKSVTGFISGIVWLGEQPLPDVEVAFTGTEEDERKAIADKGQTYFKDGYTWKGKQRVKSRLKCWPQPPRKAVAITVDYPKFTVEGLDGVSRPVRVLLNGKFIPKGASAKDAILNRVYELKYEKNENGAWTLKTNTTIYKMAVAAGVIEAGDVFTENDLGKLIGKPIQTEMQVYINEGGFFEEKASFRGSVPEEILEIGLPVMPEDSLYFIRFDKENDPEALKVLRAHIINQMTKANDYEGSVVQGELEALKPWLKDKNKDSGQEAPEQASEDDSDSDQYDGTEEEDNVSDGSTGSAGGFDDNIPFNCYMKYMV